MHKLMNNVKTLTHESLAYGNYCINLEFKTNKIYNFF